MDNSDPDGFSGSITSGGLRKVFNDCKLSDNDIVFDGGSGVGNVALVAAFIFHCRFIGFEISTAKYLIAMNNLMRLFLCNDSTQLQCGLSMNHIIYSTRTCVMLLISSDAQYFIHFYQHLMTI